MDEWNEEYLDIVETTRIPIDKRGQGDFIFGVVKGWLDCRFTVRATLRRIFLGWVERGRQCVWRGWASLQSDRSLEGHLFIHLSDDSAFVAKPNNPVKQRPRRARDEEASGDLQARQLRHMSAPPCRRTQPRQRRPLDPVQQPAAGLVTYGFGPDRLQVLPERPAPYGDLRDEQHSNNNRALSRFRPPLSCHWATSRFEQLSVSQAPSE